MGLNEVTEDGAPRSFIHDGFSLWPKAQVGTRDSITFGRRRRAG